MTMEIKLFLLLLYNAQCRALAFYATGPRRASSHRTAYEYPALLDACCPVNNPEAFSVRAMIAWSNFFKFFLT